MSEADPEPITAKQEEMLGVLPVGARLRGYEVVSVLGQGAFGITYCARDATLGRDVAIKEYLPTALALRHDGTTVRPRSTELAEEFVWGRERFLEEARTLIRLEDVPAVVRVIDFLEANGTAYMVMALARGETLDLRLRRDGPMPQAGIERMLFPLLAGLEQVHEAGFLHRDIKPANVIIDAKGAPTLIDFGAARATMAERTAAMTAIFTPGYAAAEQFTSARQGPWTDIYGLSATVYHAITGRPPPSAFDRMLDDTYEPLGSLSPCGFSPRLLAAIDAGLAVRARDRPQSITAWRALFAATTGEGDRATVMLPRPAGPSPARSKELTSAVSLMGATNRKPAGLWAAAAVAGFVVLAVGGYLAFVFPPSPSTVNVQALKAEDLERLLGERRAADAAAAEKKRLEEEALRKAEADAMAKRQADAALEKAQQDRQKAEADLAKLKAEMEVRRQSEAAGQQQLAAAEARRMADEEAQRKAEAETAALRQAEQDAQRKAAVEAENKQQADAALAKAQAERQKADEEATARRRTDAEAAEKRNADAEARQKADADAAAAVAETQKAEALAKQKADAETAAVVEKQAAEAAENALRLPLAGRQRIQVALTSLGFDTRGSDGVFGPRSREMIAAWQLKVGLPPTGFISAAQNDQLLSSATLAVSRWDEEQKRIEADRKKAEDQKKLDDEKKRADDAKAKEDAEAKARASLAPQATTEPPLVRPAGRWNGNIHCKTWPPGGMRLNLSPTGGEASGAARGGTSHFAIVIADNKYSGTLRFTLPNTPKTLSASFSGTIANDAIASTIIVRADFKNPSGANDDQCTLVLARTR